jgi:hypothetical protein
VLEARGSTKKNPQRYRDRLEAAKHAPKLEPVGPPPEHWNVAPETMGAMKFARLKVLWAEFGPQVTVRSPMRRALLEQFCVAMEKFRRVGDSMKTSEKNNLLALTSRLELDQRLASGGKGVRGTDGEWEAFG